MSDGTRLRDEFLLDPSVTFLNHGSFGAVPRAVFERYQEWQLELERQPVLFLARRLDELLAEARAALGAYVGADPDDLVFVPNASAGVNVAAWPLGLEPGDEVLSTDLEYGALDLDLGARLRRLRRALRAGLRSGLPVTSAEEIVETIWAGVGPRTKVLFISHYTSSDGAHAARRGALPPRARALGSEQSSTERTSRATFRSTSRALDADYYAATATSGCARPRVRASSTCAASCSATCTRS